MQVMTYSIYRSKFLNNIILYLFFILAVGFFLYGKSFAHINLNVFGLPVYVTELFLILTVVLVFINSIFFKDGKLFINSNQRVEFLLFYIVFIISLTRGLISNRDIVFTLRQSAIIYYSAFYFLVPIILNSFRKIKLYFSVLVICTSVLALLRLFRVEIPGLGSFSYYYISLSLIFLLFLSLLTKEKVLKFFLYSLILIHLIIIMLSEVRAAWMGLLSAILFIIFIFFKIPVMRKNLKKILLMVILTILILTIILPIFLISYPSSIEDIKDEFVSIYKFRDLETVSARNVMWRLFVWRDIIDLSLEKPIIGYGFGTPFQSETLEKIGWADYSGDENFTDPHNSYLSILFRTGFVGLIIFLIIIFRFFKLSINFILKCDNEKMRVYIASMLTTIVFILGTSFFMVVLEGPFLGIFLWINMGLVISIIRIAKAEQ